MRLHFILKNVGGGNEKCFNVSKIFQEKKKTNSSLIWEKQRCLNFSQHLPHNLTHAAYLGIKEIEDFGNGF